MPPSPVQAACSCTRFTTAQSSPPDVRPSSPLPQHHNPQPASACPQLHMHPATPCPSQRTPPHACRRRSIRPGAPQMRLLDLRTRQRRGVRCVGNGDWRVWNNVRERRASLQRSCCPLSPTTFPHTTLDSNFVLTQGICIGLIWKRLCQRNCLKCGPDAASLNPPQPKRSDEMNVLAVLLC